MPTNRRVVENPLEKKRDLSELLSAKEEASLQPEKEASKQPRLRRTHGYDADILDALDELKARRNASGRRSGRAGYVSIESIINEMLRKELTQEGLLS